MRAIAVLVAVSACATTSLEPIRTELGHDVHWRADRFPLAIRYVSTGDPSYSASFNADCRRRVGQFAEEFNRVAGRRLFREISSPKEAADIIVVGAYRPLTSIQFNSRGQIRAATVKLPCRIEAGAFDKLIVHELLHALGFDHNRSRNKAIQHAIDHAQLQLPDFLAQELRGLADPGESRLPRSRPVIAAR